MFNTNKYYYYYYYYYLVMNPQPLQRCKCLKLARANTGNAKESILIKVGH